MGSQREFNAFFDVAVFFFAIIVGPVAAGFLWGAAAGWLLLALLLFVLIKF